ncbi:MAG: pyridoxamine 5'-phosphate oxidase [Deinococcales bacterium]
MKLSDMRISYQKGVLEIADLEPDPLEQFKRWFAEVSAVSSANEVNAMTLATADLKGRVSARTVLLKGVEEGGFVFFSNYESAKAREMAENAQVALLFYWGLERQIRIEGIVSQLSREASEAYFHSRPYQSQLGSAASSQSQVLASREILEKRMAELSAKHPKQVPLPDFWGGYLVKPNYFEFWQGRENRLHDRFSYRPQVEGWLIERLYP